MTLSTTGQTNVSFTARKVPQDKQCMLEDVLTYQHYNTVYACPSTSCLLDSSSCFLTPESSPIDYSSNIFQFQNEMSSTNSVSHCYNKSISCSTQSLDWQQGACLQAYSNKASSSCMLSNSCNNWQRTPTPSIITPIQCQRENQLLTKKTEPRSRNISEHNLRQSLINDKDCSITVSRETSHPITADSLEHLDWLPMEDETIIEPFLISDVLSAHANRNEFDQYIINEEVTHKVKIKKHLNQSSSDRPRDFNAVSKKSPFDMRLQQTSDSMPFSANYDTVQFCQYNLEDNGKNKNFKILKENEFDFEIDILLDSLI